LINVQQHVFAQDEQITALKKELLMVEQDSTRLDFKFARDSIVSVLSALTQVCQEKRCLAK